MPLPFPRVVQSVTRRLGLEPGEGRLLVLMGALVALLLCAYTIAKVLRDALFLGDFGALALPYAYVGVAVASAGYVFIEGRVARRFSGIGASRFNQYSAIGFSILAAAALPRARHATIALFYLWTGAQAMMLLPHFWGLALDVWNSRRARRLFPILSGCGLIGGLVGGGFAAWSAPVLGHVGLMWVLSGLLVVARALTSAVDRHRAFSPDMAGVVSSVSSWEIVRRSGYIKVLTLGLALSVIVGTLVDFQFKTLVLRMYPEPHELTRFLGAFYVGLNAVSLLFQFGAAGWLLQRIGLGPSTGLQPGAVLVFAAWAAVTTGGWAIVGMRWIQGVVSQTLGKSSTEIYYAAIRPDERRRIKPAIDTLVERWSDALVGILLVILLHLLRVPVATIAVGTAVLAGVWLLVLFVLDRQYGRAFHEALSRRWIEPEAAPESMRLPAARKALLLALRSDDERQLLLALKLSVHTRDVETGRAVRACLEHHSPGIRAAAVAAMEAMRVGDPEGVIDTLLTQPHADVRRAAVGYLLSRGKDPTAFARRVLEGDDLELQGDLLDALFERPLGARAVLTDGWVDARIASGARTDLLLAARATGAMEGKVTVLRLRALLANPDPEIRRTALLSAAKRPRPELLDLLIPLLIDSEPSHEALGAVAAVGDPAVPELHRLLGGERGERAQLRAASALARIATPRAVKALMTLVRGGDLRLRYLGLQGMRRVRVRTGRPTLPRATAHRLFLRELRDYRGCLEPADSLANRSEPEVRLLGASYRESADWALERALQSLSCWYDPKPLIGVYDRLKSRDLSIASPALEYLGHVLPRSVFRPVATIFERNATEVPDLGLGGDRLGEWIALAWETGDAWLRACAVRASRHAPDFDRARFATGDGSDTIVRAELDALSGSRADPVRAPAC